MADLDLDQTVETMTAPSAQRLAALAAVTTGDAAVPLNALRRTAADMLALAQQAADRVTALRANDQLPLEHRQRVERETIDTTRVLLGKMNAAAHAQVPKYRAAQEDGLVPSAARTDSGVRLLRRQEIETAMSAQPGTRLQQARRILGRSPAWDGELMSDYGRALLGDDWDAVRAEMVGTWRARSDGTARQLSSRRALGAMDDANVPGAIAAYNTAALLLLQAVENRAVRQPAPPGVTPARAARESWRNR